MTKINGMEVTHPFLPNRSKERWTTIGTIDIKNLENGKIQVTNETVNISATADTFEEALQEVNNKVQTELNNGNVFLGRSGY
jgi:hypothetical protein